jgi:hypothetical protein
MAIGTQNRKGKQNTKQNKNDRKLKKLQEINETLHGSESEEAEIGEEFLVTSNTFCPDPRRGAPSAVARPPSN